MSSSVEITGYKEPVLSIQNSFQYWGSAPPCRHMILANNAQYRAKSQRQPFYLWSLENSGRERLQSSQKALIFARHKQKEHTVFPPKFQKGRLKSQKSSQIFRFTVHLASTDTRVPHLGYVCCYHWCVSSDSHSALILCHLRLLACLSSVSRRSCM